jgi:hypothetical protein
VARSVMPCPGRVGKEWSSRPTSAGRRVRERIARVDRSARRHRLAEPAASSELVSEEGYRDG